MKIPKSVRIGGIEYKIELVPMLDDGHIVCYGEITYGDTTIRINRGKSSHEMQCVTLWHEILHALCTHSNLKLGDDEEKIVDTFAYGIYQVLQDNGKRLFDIVALEDEASVTQKLQTQEKANITQEEILK